jgi:hypothetical protein
MARTVDRNKLTEWQRRFARHRASGLTVAEFCRREGVKAGRWKYWQRQVERLTASELRRTASRAVFQAVEIIYGATPQMLSKLVAGDEPEVDTG